MGDKLDCDRCPIGARSGRGAGHFCPWVSRRYQPGDVLWREGEAADYVWFVKEGAVSIARDGETLRSPGGVIGVEPGVRESTATVIEPSTLCGATREGFETWLEVTRKGEPGAADLEPALRSSPPIRSGANSAAGSRRRRRVFVLEAETDPIRAARTLK